MRAAILREYDATPDLGDFDEPGDKDGAVVAEVLAAGLNPVDVRKAAGVFPLAPKPPLPSVAGWEGVARMPDGSRAYFADPPPPWGALAERTLLRPAETFPVPYGVDDGVAVALGIAGSAGWLALEWSAKLREGETVLVLGASGTVGQVAVQAAKLLGAGRVVAAARSESGLARAAELGADATVRIGRDDLAASLMGATDGGADVILDPLWGEPAAAALKAVREGARMVQVGHSAGPSAPIVPAPLRPARVDIRFHGASSVPDEVKRLAYETMADHLVAGELVVDVERIPLDDVADAWRRQREFPHKKLVLVP
jgi:NADPH:quinone reductase-like Zn-dependent oxidoreductase